MMDITQFMNSVKKVNNHRNHITNNSYGVYDGYKYYRKNKPIGKDYILTESQYFAIIRTINKLLAESLLDGDDISFPHRMGKLEVRKYKSIIKSDGKKIRTNLPIDWNSTLRLWYEDKESYKNKTLIKIPEKEIYKIYYNKNIANFNNKSFYEFKVNREFKLKLKDKIKLGEFDSFTY